MTSFQVAVILMLISTSLMSISCVVLKLAATNMPPMETQSLTTNLVALITNRTWIFGFALSVSALALNWLALGKAEMSAIQPLYGFGLVTLLITARIVLKEKISPREAIGVAFAIAGVALVGIGAVPSQTTLSQDTLVPIYTATPSLLWMGALLGFMAISGLLCRAFSYKGAGIVFAVQTSIATILGLTFSKGFFSLCLSQGFAQTLAFPPALVFVLLFLAFSLAALFLQQFAFQKGRAVIVAPIINILQVALPLPAGILIFHETIQRVQIAGIAALIAGGIFLSFRSQTTKN